jgi:hypothetical protein
MRLRIRHLIVFAIAGVLPLGCGESGDDPQATTTPVGSSSSSVSTAPEPVTLTKRDARDFVRSHYAAVNAGDYDRAFGNFSRDLRAELGPKTVFKKGYDATVRSRPHDLTVISIVPGERAEVAFGLSAVAEDACGDRINQEYVGTWVIKARESRLVFDGSNIEQTSDDQFVTSVADCPSPPPRVKPPPTPPASSGDCHPSYRWECLDPSVSDYDCLDGDGDGPEYVVGPVRVVGPDEYGLDRDNNGIGCE